MTMEPMDLKDLATARGLLEHPGVAAKVTNLLGTPIEKGIDMLPENWQDKITEVTRTALYRALDIAVHTMDTEQRGQHSEDIWHKVAVAATGGIGGAFGIAALAVELPVSTTIMLRSIADIARSEGEDLTDAGAQLSCMEVFALGGPSNADDATETGYFAVRAALAAAMREAAQHIAAKGAAKGGAPPLARLVILIAERFGTQVTEKVAAQLVPAIGAAGGAVINTVFMDHFQKMARGHFIVRRLERKYGFEVVKRNYDALDA